MMFPRTGRKKSRPGGAFPREPQEPGPRPWFLQGWEPLIVAVSFVVLVAAVTKPPAFPRKPIGYDIDTQTVALEEVRADVSFEAEDLQATKKKRDEAAAHIPDMYRVDRERVQQQLRTLDDRIQALLGKADAVERAVRTALKTSNSQEAESDVVAKAVAGCAVALKEDKDFKEFPDAESLGVWLMPKPECLPKRQFAPPPKGNGDGQAAARVTGLLDPEETPLAFAYEKDLSRLAREGLEYVLTYGVIAERKPQTAERDSIVVLREDPVAEQRVSDEIPLQKVPTPKEAAELLSARLTETARAVAAKEPDRTVDWAKLQNAAFEMAAPALTDTLFFDAVSTEGARERARLAVQPVLKEIQPGEVIQRSGDKWTAQSRSDVRTYWDKLQAKREPISRVFATLASNLIFVALVIACLGRSVAYLTSKVPDVPRNVNLGLLLMAATLVLGRLVSYFDPSGFVLPVVASGILLAILVNPRIAIISSFLTAALVSVQFGYDWRLLVVGSAMSAAGVFSTYVVRRRGDMTRAALKATVVGVAMMAAITLAMDLPLGGAALRRMLLVLLNGGLCLFIVPGVLSPLERLFRITTDIQLLEYSDLNNELLSRMAIEIPATYAHSLMLGQVAEAAADAIGANGLLARVCAYYHDIGKMRRPEYFSENQTGVNVHEQMPPRLSARAVAAHVTYGVEIAREHRIPKPIVDGIREHHGTCLIGFFYQQAVEQHKHDDVCEEDFRYPGPKPQSRETAILMICDAVESGVRSIKNPNEDRIREFVDKIVAARAADGQFDECSLTLKDLDTIKKVAARRVTTALHTRIAYPDKGPEKKADNVIPLSGGAAP